MKKFAALVAVLALVAFAAPAFAANPFMDVPMNHWAYDAVSQLASRGVVSGYPDGAFKGEWKATRYEMASVVARALAYVDMNKASKQDLELLKKLVVEFKDELDALGVKVDELDSRVAVLEDGVGGWKIGGEFRFDAKWSDAVGTNADPYNLSVGSKTDFTMSRYRLHFWKQIDDKVKFYGRYTASDAGATYATTMWWDRYFLTVAFPWDVTMVVGLYNMDWEADDGLYVGDNDAFVTDITERGFHFTKDFSMGTFQWFVNHVENTATTTEYYRYAARVKFNFNEQFSLALNYMNQDFYGTTADQKFYWANAQVNFSPDVALKVAYYKDDTNSANAWKAIVDVSQNAFGFTSLWLEYATVDAAFNVYTGAYNWIADNSYGLAGTTDATIWNIYAEQKWNDKWTTWVRYVKIEDTTRDAKNWTAAVKYFYTPALSFELAYDKYDDSATLDESLIRFRTYVSF